MQSKLCTTFSAWTFVSVITPFRKFVQLKHFKGNHDGNSIGYYQKKHIKVLQRETFCREKLFFRPIFSVFSRFLSHENIRRFLMFSGELKENIGKKWAELQMFKYTLVIKEEPQIWKFAAWIGRIRLLNIQPCVLTRILIPEILFYHCTKNEVFHSGFLQ